MNERHEGAFNITQARKLFQHRGDTFLGQSDQRTQLFLHLRQRYLGLLAFAFQGLLFYSSPPLAWMRFVLRAISPAACPLVS